MAGLTRSPTIWRFTLAQADHARKLLQKWLASEVGVDISSTGEFSLSPMLNTLLVRRRLRELIHDNVVNSSVILIPPSHICM
ncbi:hypothetical protein LshimejAT787_0501580 [Lyophyllum shimeji]|uniref:Uncharacterized protein n=1 Tax=Lyophyllum shimeji TaxID=47721 RepID=A0A9P3PLU0_LYOSH|nr:hypothetical protein LshimejAT787_0501580 [Lyophyllum shimeji]